MRNALAHAIDVDTLIAALLTVDGRVHGRRAVGTVSPELRGVGEPDIEPLTHDPERARALLAEAGWTDSDGDGWVDRDGEPLRFELRTNAGNPRRAQVQVIVQEQLRGVGVDARPATLEGNAFFDSLREHDFEAAIAGWGSSLFVDPSRKWRSDGVYNYPSYASDEVDALVDGGLSTADPTESARCWQELQQVVYRDQPYCFLYWREELVAVHDRFQDVGVDTLWLFDRLPEWWVPADRQRARR